ncbi:potassium voltage-gated channel subfamily S member 1 [Pseudoliparis swirei]|uniref:potassium voltage-gated channel subfamily S member 1 n=1 Tax=Pseudoliparis swirei TaxID=2059687 RepID=UPI0024BEC428|nr:potassium voltage-gated channel subfamily S member 1 [Pseudoliparis swirei]
MVTQRDPHGGLLHVNIGGLKRSLCCTSLRRFPDTRLGKLLSCDSEEAILQVCDDYDVQQEEFYFDRSPGLFPYVLHFYRTGKLHVMEELCVFSFSQEMEYWGINEFFLDSCCSLRYHDRKMENRRRRSWDDESDASSEEEEEEEDEISELNRDLRLLRLGPCGASRKLLWLMMENPSYSASSRVFSLLSIGVVLTSIAMVCIRSIPEYQTFDDEGKVMDDPTMEALEALCTGWFTFEVVARLLLAPNKRKFFRQPLNLIDVVSVGPVYVTVVSDITLGPESELGALGRLMQVLRLMRVFRVLKLARHSTGLRSLGATLRHSYREVGILLLYIAVGVSVFSGIVYTAEYEEGVGLDTIPACWWWGTVSMTTVGYGDLVPVTVAGKLAASGCILGGTLVVALPITIIFNKFSYFYRRQKALEASVRSNHRGAMNCENQEEEEEHREDEADGGVLNYSYVEHPSSWSTPRRKEVLQEE